MRKFLLITLSVVMLAPNFFNDKTFEEETFDGKEEYDPSLNYINTIAKLESYTDSVVRDKHIAEGSFEQVSEITNAIRRRFFHGYSHYINSENWATVLVGKYISQGIACKVQPEEIIQHSNAACSQQAIVMMAVLHNKKIPYRHLGFPHHYAMDVFIRGKWYFFDPDKEPVMTQAERCETAWQYKSDNLKKYYSPKQSSGLDFALGNGLSPEKGAINEVPALNARMFHNVTWAFSKIAWLLPLGFLLFYRFARNNTNKTSMQHVFAA